MNNLKSFVARAIVFLTIVQIAGFVFAAGPAEFASLIDLSSGTLSAIGRLKTKTALEIPSSRHSIGFETLDRKMWDPEKVYPQVAKLGAKWARVQTGWARCEKVKGQYDFAWLDKIVDSLRAIGIQPWFNVGYGNRLYIPGAPHETAVGWAPIFTPEAREGWEKFVSALAAHFKGRVGIYEAWNEPDIGSFWTPSQPSPEQYVQLVEITARAIRAQDPQAKILGGALSQTSRLAFLDGCLAAGLAKHIDALTYHVYYPNPEPFYNGPLQAMREHVARAAPGLELWQGESGVPSLAQQGQALASYVWTEERQAKWAARRTMLDLAFDVPFIAYFHASDFMFYIVKDQTVDKRYYFGLVGGDDYQPKPAYYAYQSLCTLFAGQVKPAEMKYTISPEPEDATSATLPRACAFNTEYGLILGFWEPSNLQKPYAPRQVTLEAELPATLKEPVLLDPISQKIYAFGKSENLHGNRYRFASLPLTDWPLLIADRASLPMSR